MGLIPDWLKYFPGELWNTFKENVKENWPEFKAEIAGGTKAVLEIPAKVIKTISKPLYMPFVIMGIIALVILILWNKLTKKGII